MPTAALSARPSIADTRTYVCEVAAIDRRLRVRPLCKSARSAMNGSLQNGYTPLNGWEDLRYPPNRVDSRSARVLRTIRHNGGFWRRIFL